MHHVSKTLSSFEQIETLASLLKESRLYYLDLAPKLVPCRGELVELLISSGVGRYIEFKALDKTHIYSEKEDNFDKVIFIIILIIIIVITFKLIINCNRNLHRFLVQKKTFSPVKQYL